ncbi:flavin reductase (NADPH)-like isoform X2 [Physella acuta]|uniref:flavin reductase (NADPH)-like isoform X2 n=1 Tax=Physella acuta TaxID=109671 RepID=UPI0027DD58DE|nr:flavin reductase (NADPH)-like isoform X2 [Physella acuta]
MNNTITCLQTKAASITSMKVVILGATGPTGIELTHEALRRGYEVTLLVRNPEKVTILNEKLKVVHADLEKSDELVDHLKGCDVVVSALGGKAGIMTPCDVYSKCGQAVVKAMREAGLKRLIAVTAWGTKDDPGLPFIWRWVLKPSFLRNIVKDMEVFEEFLLTDCSDINYTVVRPPRLTTDPSDGEKVLVNEGLYVPDITNNSITRQDLAKFMLDAIGNQEYYKKMVAVAGGATTEKK